MRLMNNTKKCDKTHDNSFIKVPIVQVLLSIIITWCKVNKSMLKTLIFIQEKKKVE